MLHGYTFEKNGYYFTRITGFDDKTVKELSEKYIRYDNDQIHGNAMFAHVTEQDFLDFYKKYNIIRVDDVDEFKLIAKLMY